MRFQLLGPVQASDGGRELDLGPPKQKALLALLLLEERSVSLDHLVDELWADPPATAPKMVHIYISGLRKALGARSIRTTRAGYELDVDGADVDVRSFRSLREGARREPHLAASRLREALELWHGEPLADLVGEPFADRERARLEDERLDAFEDRIRPSSISASQQTSVSCRRSSPAIPTENVCAAC
jgi:DNA-binding SARP family transcriptional activator